MHYKVVAIGPRMPSWVDVACAHYLKLLRGYVSIDVVPVPASPQKPNQSEVQRERESKALLEKVSSQDTLIVLDRLGVQWSTEEFSRELESQQQSGRNVVFMIGGAEGLSQECLQRANRVWSLSKLTFPHALVRIMALEQLYRAISFSRGHPYHRP